MTNTTTESSSQTDFRIFQGEDNLWVLRDVTAHYDYPFASELSAVKGIELRVKFNVSLIGSPAEHNTYGAPPAFESEATA